MSKSKCDESEDDVLFELIDAIKEFPCIWNPSIPEYSQQGTVKKAWNRVSSKLCQNEDIIRKKWKNLKDVYRRNRTKVVKSKRSGSGAGDVYNPSWIFYDVMKFIDPAHFDCSSRSNIPKALKKNAPVFSQRESVDYDVDVSGVFPSDDEKVEEDEEHSGSVAAAMDNENMSEISEDTTLQRRMPPRGKGHRSNADAEKESDEEERASILDNEESSQVSDSATEAGSVKDHADTIRIGKRKKMQAGAIKSDEFGKTSHHEKLRRQQMNRRQKIEAEERDLLKQTLQVMKESSKPGSSGESSADRAYADYITMELQKLPENKKSLAKLRIQEVLYNIQETGSDQTISANCSPSSSYSRSSQPYQEQQQASLGSSQIYQQPVEQQRIAESIFHSQQYPFMLQPQQAMFPSLAESLYSHENEINKEQTNLTQL